MDLHRVPCYDNASFFWIRNAAPADDQLFKREVEKLGIEWCIMKRGDEIEAWNSMSNADADANWAAIEWPEGSSFEQDEL
jgi:hypothetical protein